MGLPLKDIVTAQELPWDALAGRTLAVDGYNVVYQFLATIRQRDGQLFCDTEGRVTSHLMGVFYRTTALLREGVLPVWVFDGKPPERKAGTIRQWRFRRRIPDAVRSTMSIYLGGSFQIVDFEPAAPRCGLTLAQQVARYLK